MTGKIFYELLTDTFHKNYYAMRMELKSWGRSWTFVL